MAVGDGARASPTGVNRAVRAVDVAGPKRFAAADGTLRMRTFETRRDGDTLLLASLEVPFADAIAILSIRHGIARASEQNQGVIIAPQEGHELT